MSEPNLKQMLQDALDDPVALSQLKYLVNSKGDCAAFTGLVHWNFSDGRDRGSCPRCGVKL